MKETHENYIMYSLLALVIFVLVFALSGSIFQKSSQEIKSQNPIAKDNNVNNADANSGAFKSIDSGSTNTGDVSVELTPYSLGGGQLKVKIAVNTHSVDISQIDLKQATLLEYNGKVVKPLSAPVLQGHHSNGELVFEVSEAEKLNSFVIKIKGIPQVQERAFTWQI